MVDEAMKDFEAFPKTMSICELISKITMEFRRETGEIPYEISLPTKLYDMVRLEAGAKAHFPPDSTDVKQVAFYFPAGMILITEAASGGPRQQAEDHVRWLLEARAKLAEAKEVLQTLAAQGSSNKIGGGDKSDCMAALAQACLRHL
jgi:hypothetical protein